MITRVSVIRRVYAAIRPIESPEFLSVPPRTKEWNESSSGLFLVAEPAEQFRFIGPQVILISTMAATVLRSVLKTKVWKCFTF